MSSQIPTYTRDEFERESRRIDALTFETLALEKGQHVLFCGFTADGTFIRRAVDLGCSVSVIEAREDIIRENANLGVRIVRGSTSVIPARENAYDVAVAVYYLHEVDPSFHTQIFSELGRVASRVALVELGPPADPLGHRIAALYSRAKRDFGAFENYQSIDYWKKRLQGIKAEVSQAVFAFAKIPPREYLTDTIALILKTMEIEEAPPDAMKELRELAKRRDAQLLPQPRYVLVGATAGDLPTPRYSPATNAQTESVLTVLSAAAAASIPPPSPSPALAAARLPPSAPVAPPAGFGVQAAPEMPPPPQPPTAAPAFGAPPQPSGWGPPATPASTPFGIPAGTTPPPPQGASGAPFGAPFAIPPASEPSPFGLPPATTTQMAPNVPGIGQPGWAWEPPEDDQLG